MAMTKQQRALLKAVKEGDIKQVKTLAKKLPFLDFEGTNGRTPLEEAIIKGRITIVRALVAEGASIDRLNDDDKSPLDIARQHGKKNIEKFLLDEGAYDYGSYGSGTGAWYDDDWGDEWVNGGSKKKSARTSARSFNAAADAEGETPKKKADQPKYTKDMLTEKFNAKNWVGKTEEMEKEWKDVPARFQKNFDFDAALAEAKRETLRKNVPTAPSLKLPPAPPPPTTPPAGQ